MELLQPYIDAIVGALIGLLVSFVLGVVAMLRVKVTAWLESKTTLQQREILHRLAQEGMSLVEQMYKDANGTDKFNEAFAYAQSRLDRYGIKIPKGDIIAAIEKAVLDYNSKVKGGAAGANTGPSTSDIGKSS